MQMATAEDEFAEIRPYRDDEVRQVLDRLLVDREFLSAVAAYRFPLAYRIAPGLLRALVGQVLARRVAHFDSVDDFQFSLESWFDRMIAGTTDGLSWSGAQRLDPKRAYLFVSNHRDIAMDSGFLNYALHAEGHRTSRIAIGDNLLQKPYATDLMRLNKSFVVKRSAKGVREQLAAYTQTSRFLHHSIAEGHSVWIAQREGRAKDGDDRTDPAIIKMFHLSERKSGRAFADVMANLHIVPVAISYELDPCDAMKAHELKVRSESGSYQKPPDEDIQSIVMGITGDKARVHVHFGPELSGSPADADAVAQWLDDEIHAGFRLFPTHLEAWRRRGGDVPETLARSVGEFSAATRERFDARIAAVPAEERDFLLLQYANPVANRLAFEDADQAAKPSM